MKIDKKFKKIRDKPNTLFTILIYNFKRNEFIKNIKDKIEDLKKIKDTFKRKILNDRLYNFRCYLEELSEEELNSVFFINDEVHEFKIDENDRKTLKTYEIKKLYYFYDDRFDYDYIDNLFNDFNFYSIGELNKNKLMIFDINSTKVKLISQIDIKEIKDLNNNITNLYLLHGESSLLKKNDINIISFNKKLSKDEILEEVNKIIIKENHIKLEKLISNISNPKFDGKIIFGGIETKKYTEMNMIKTLFIHTKIYKKYKRIYSDFINFELIEIKKLSNGDISEKLFNDFDKCIGILYF